MGVRKWLDEHHPQIAARTKAEGAEIYGDGKTELRSDDVRGRGCAPKGQAPVMRVDHQREGLCLISTATN